MMIHDNQKVLKTNDKSLLIVDDDNSFRERLSRAMEKKGFEVLQAESVKRGVEVAKIDRNGGSDLAVHGLNFSVTLVILANLIIFPAIVLSLHQGWLVAGKHCISGLTFWVNLII